MGYSLLEYILSSNLVVLNRGIEPTFINSVRSEVLDITLNSLHLAHLIRNWRVSNDILTSDHRSISFHIDTDKPKRLKLKKTCECRLVEVP